MILNGFQLTTRLKQNFNFCLITLQQEMFADMTKQGCVLINLIFFQNQKRLQILKANIKYDF